MAASEKWHHLAHVYLLVFVFLPKSSVTIASASAHSVRPPLNCSIREEQPPGYPVIDLLEYFAETNNRLPSSNQTFALNEGQKQYLELFFINGSILTTNRFLDREALCPSDPECILRLDLAVHSGAYFEAFKVEVKVIDLNDNSPTFRQSTLEKSIPESTSPGVLFQILPAYDLDSLANAEIVYRLEPAEESPFRLIVRNSSYGSGTADLRLELVKSLDREKQNQYDLKLLAADAGTPSRTGTLDLRIDVADVNDNSPRFDTDQFEVTVDLDIPVGTTVATVRAFDPDEGPNGRVRYRLSKRTQAVYGRIFSVDPDSGEVRTESRLDDLGYQTSYHLYVQAEDLGENSTPTVTSLIVNLRGSNDHVPEILVHALSGTDATAEVQENNVPGSFVASVTVVDPDVGLNGETECQMAEETYFTIVRLRDSEFKLLTATSFDREQRDLYSALVECHDLGEPSFTSWLNLSVIIADADDNPPVFSKSFYNVTVAENNEKNVVLVQVRATDPDSGRNADVEYVLDSDAEDWFRVDRLTGTVTAQVSFDREFVDAFDFHVIARGGRESGNGTSGSVPGTAGYRHVAKSRIHVTVTDVDDEPPRFSKSWYKFDIAENLNSGAIVGQVEAMDEDLPPYDRFSYHLEYSPEDGTGSGHFAVDPVSGAIYTRQTLDREALSHYTLRISARSDVSLSDVSAAAAAASDVTVVFIRVADVNDNAPVFSFPTPDDNTVRAPQNVGFGYTLATMRAYDRDLDRNGEVTYSIVAGNERRSFLLDSVSGKLTWNSEVPFQFSKDCPSTLFVEARDGGYPYPLVTTAQIHVVCEHRPSSDPPHPDGYNVPDAGGITEPGTGLSGLHFLILAGVLACCLVVVVVLIAAICATGRRQSRAGSGRQRARDRPSTEELKEKTILMLDKQNLSLDGETIVLSLRTEPTCHFEVQRLARSDVSNSKHVVTSMRDRDTDSGCVDVSPV